MGCWRPAAGRGRCRDGGKRLSHAQPALGKPSAGGGFAMETSPAFELDAVIWRRGGGGKRPPLNIRPVLHRCPSGGPEGRGSCCDGGSSAMEGSPASELPVAPRRKCGGGK